MTIDVQRPTGPDNGLLQSAALAIPRVVGVPAGAETKWEVSPRIDRPRSSLYQLRASTTSGTVIEAYYKVLIPQAQGSSERADERIARARSGLEVGQMMEDRLAPLLEREGILIPRTLAVDVANLAIVTLKIPGTPFGRELTRVLTRERRAHSLSVMSQVGRATYLIDVSAPTGIANDDLDDLYHMSRRLARVEDQFTASELSAIERLVAVLYPNALDTTPIVYAHGDLSTSNVLVGESVGLIDFTWLPQLQGSDLSNMAFRLEYGPPAASSAVRSLISALIDGYGDPGVVETSAWKLQRLAKLLKVVRHGSGSWYRRQLPKYQRAVSEIRRMVADSV